MPPIATQIADVAKDSDTARLDDLESPICDVAEMANICVMLTEVLERNERSTAEMEITAKQAADSLAYYRETVLFSVLHLKGMTIALKKQYYAFRGIGHPNHPSSPPVRRRVFL